MEKFVEYTKDQDDNREEQRRLEGQHEVILYHMGTALYAPVDMSRPGLEILDSGCANGRWLRDLKGSSPAEHQYYGTDIEESLYPTPAPSGMHFQNQSIKDDFPLEWRDKFDLVHQRLVMGGAAPGKVGPIVEKLASVLKPEGWMQLVEMNMDPTPGNGPMLSQLIRMLREMFETVGVGANFAKDLSASMTKAGLVNVQEREFLTAQGMTIKDKSLLEKSIVSPVSAVGPVLQVLRSIPNSFSKEELDGFQDRLRKELEEKGGHTRILVVWGQKPAK